MTADWPGYPASPANPTNPPPVPQPARQPAQPYDQPYVHPTGESYGQQPFPSAPGPGPRPLQQWSDEPTPGFTTSQWPEPSTEPPVVRVVGLSKSYGDREVLRNISFDIPRGRVVGLLGRNGAGKTTLMKALLGTASLNAGQVRIFDAPPGPGLAQRVGVAMDGIGFYPAATVQRELTIWATALGVPRRRVHDVIDLVELNGHQRQRCSKLSTGQRQRLRLATALLQPDVELLMLDEPANGLDPDGVRWIRRFIRDMATAGKTVLVSSHQLAELENTVDDVLLLDKGVLVHSGTLHDFTAGGQYRLEDRFFQVVGGMTI